MLIPVIRSVAVPVRKLQARGVIGIDDARYALPERPDTSRNVDFLPEVGANLLALSLLEGPADAGAATLPCDEKRFAMTMKQDLSVVVEEDQGGASTGGLVHGEKLSGDFELLDEQQELRDFVVLIAPYELSNACGLHGRRP
jgi:hypothetical protein